MRYPVFRKFNFQLYQDDTGWYSIIYSLILTPDHLNYSKDTASFLAMANNRLENLQETDLLLRLRDGDQYAFDYFFKKHYAPLCFFSARLTSDKFVAEEIVQDVLFKLWHKHADFNNSEAIKAFLYISTRNASINYLDKEERKTKHHLNIAALEDETEDPILNEIIYTEVLNEISLEINSLPEQCAKIIKMIFEEEMKPHEIATELNITVSTVYNQKMRGISILKRRLSGRGFNALIVLGLYLFR
jgi:RNA polymerase sigma-70 factor (family 1)